MNYNIKIDENIVGEKIVIPKKNYYCSNCNKKGHTFKNCNEPIISNGIIAVYIKNLDKSLIPYLENYIIKNLKTTNLKTTNNVCRNYKINKSNSNSNLTLDRLETKFATNDDNNFNDPTYINDNIQFLMVQRKNSLGYLEFMRGRYNVWDKKHIIHLIEQMTPEEINNICTKDFDFLWNNLWDLNNIKNKNHHKEYTISKQKFYDLKLNCPDIIINTKPLYHFNEWGFPKGRRELYESDLVCAIREFEEETNLDESKYIVMEKCKSIRENLIGTNGINYAHNYFLSVIDDNIELKNEKNREIGQTKILNISECLDKIRPYHINKIKIIKTIYCIINNFLRECLQFE